MNDDQFVIDTMASSYVESLIRSRCDVKDVPKLVKKLDAIILLELDMMLMASQKAKTKLQQDNIKKLRPV